MNNINYKLAKQLKDAGFESKDSALIGSSQPDEDGYVVPNLSELIEACGKEINGKFFRLVANPFSWTAEYSIKGMCEYTFQMPTPEEAVAKLWLKLNER